MFLDGQFGAYMQVHIQNDGPVTIELVSPSAPMDPKQVQLMLLISASRELYDGVILRSLPLLGYVLLDYICSKWFRLSLNTHCLSCYPPAGGAAGLTSPCSNRWRTDHDQHAKLHYCFS